MGRPPLNLEETKVRLTAGSQKRIIALVGVRRMAAFVRKAVDDALKQAEQERAGSSPKKAQSKPSSV